MPQVNELAQSRFSRLKVISAELVDAYCGAMLRNALAFIALLVGATPTFAQASPSLDEVAHVTILPGWRTESGTHMTALRVQLAPGWKTYWRAPGDSGIPPRFDWTGSENVSGVTLHWPVPQVYDLNGMRTVGYDTELVLPMELMLEQRDGAIALRGTVELGVCLDICIPMNAAFDATLTFGGSDPRILAALNNQPVSSAEGGVAAARCAVEPIKDGLRVTASLSLPAVGPDEIAVIEHDDQRIWVAEAMSERSGGTLTAVTELVPPTNKPFSLDRSDLRITVIANGRAVEINGCTG